MDGWKISFIPARRDLRGAEPPPDSSASRNPSPPEQGGSSCWPQHHLLVMNQTRLKIQSSLSRAFIDSRGKGGIWICLWISRGYPGICLGWDMPCMGALHGCPAALPRTYQHFCLSRLRFFSFPSGFQRQERVLCPPFLGKTLVRNDVDGADWDPCRL